MNHTPEPWKLDDLTRTAVEDARGLVIAYCGGTAQGNDAIPANAERIVACVNAMEGIEDPEGWVLSVKASWGGW